jgi:NADH-quinone oxidoreductase subunit E
MAFALSAELERQLEQIIVRYPNKMAACLPALQMCQRSNGGHVSDEVIAFVAERLELGTAHVEGVVTFYSLLCTRPPGRHQVWVCHTLSCALRGSESLLAHCEKRLGIRAGETTPDGRVTLRTAECLASCGSGPVIQVDERFYEHLTTDEVDRILDRLLFEG